MTCDEFRRFFLTPGDGTVAEHAAARRHKRNCLTCCLWVDALARRCAAKQGITIEQAIAATAAKRAEVERAIAADPEA